jgi:3-polyprenyl-4-hydroxybenzoate decarboxylase
MEVPHRRRLKIDLAELAYAFENSDWETDYFLDLETGKIIMVKESTFRDLENIMDEHEETEEEDEIDLPDVLDEDGGNYISSGVVIARHPVTGKT